MSSNPHASCLILHRILIIGPAWIGDMVMAQSLFITLKQRFSDCSIDVLAPEWSGPLLARMPEVHACIPLPVSHGEFGFGTRWKLGRSLRGHYDWAIVTPRSWKKALVPFFARVPRRSGYRGEWRYGLINDMRRLDKKLLPLAVQRYVALGLDRDASLPPPVPRPALRVDVENRERLLETLGLNGSKEVLNNPVRVILAEAGIQSSQESGHRLSPVRRINQSFPKPVIAMAPGAEGPGKRWPVERYAELAKRLITRGKQVWVFGSAKERELGEQIERATGAGAVNLCGRTRLEDVVDLMSLAETVVTNDSGLMHVAAAVGVEVVVIYGASSPDYTPPLTDKAVIVRGSSVFDETARRGDADYFASADVDRVEAQVV